MAFKTLERNNITVKASFKFHKTLVIFFPSSATAFRDYDKFLGDIISLADIIYVCAGYKGLIVNDKHYNPYSLEKFIQVFYASFGSEIDKYGKVILVGQSFGACIAYKLYKSKQSAKLILVSPPFSEKSFKSNMIIRLLLNLIADTSMGSKLTNFFEPAFLAFCSKFKLDNNQQLFVKALKRAGIVNYLSCIRETVKYGVIDEDTIPQDIIMVFGKNDPFLNSYCRQSNMHKRKNSYFLDQGHTILQNEWGFMLRYI